MELAVRLRKVQQLDPGIPSQWKDLFNAPGCSVCLLSHQMNLGQATSAAPPCSHLYSVTVESNTRLHLPQHFLMNIFKHGKVEEIEQRTPKYPPQAHSTISTLLSSLCHTPALLSVHQIRLIFLMHHTHPCISPKHMVNTTVNLSKRIKPQFSFFVCE